MLDDRAGHAQLAAERLFRLDRSVARAAAALAVALALDLQLAGALVLDEHADVLGLREQIEQRVDDLLEQRLARCRLAAVAWRIW